MSYSTAFHKLDFLSPLPCLYINSYPRYSTILGITVSFLVVLGLSAMAMYFMLHFIFGNEMTVIYSKDTSMEDFHFDLTNKLFAFQFYNYSNGNSVDPRIATVAGYLWTYRGNTTIVEPLQLEPCEFDKHFPKDKYQPVFDHITINKYTCVNTPTNLTLYANQSEITGTYIMLFLATCNNSTQNNNHCLPHDLIEQYMKHNQYYFTPLLENVNVNHYNSTSPLSFSPFINSYTLSYSIRTDMVFNWQPIEYKEDTGWLFVSERSYHDFIMEESLNKISFSADGHNYYHKNAFSKIQFSIHYQSITKYMRTYPKIQSVIASMSGIITVTNQIAQLLMSLLALGKYYYFVYDCGECSLLPSASNKISSYVNNYIYNNNNNNISSNVMLCNNNKHKSNNYGTSLYKEASEIVELKSKRTIGNTNCVIGNSNNNNKKQHDDVSYMSGLTWMICPKCSKDTTRFARFERKVKRMLSVENVVKMFVRLKVNEKAAATCGYGEGWGVQQQQMVGTGVTCLGNYNGNNKISGNNNNNNVMLKKKKTGQSWKWLSTNIQQQRGNNNNNNVNTNLAMQDDVNTRKNSESIKMHPINFNVKAIQKADINFET